MVGNLARLSQKVDSSRSVHEDYIERDFTLSDGGKKELGRTSGRLESPRNSIGARVARVGRGCQFKAT